MINEEREKMDDPNHVLQVITIRYCSRNAEQFADITNFFKATEPGKNKFNYMLDICGFILEVEDPQLQVPGRFVCQVYMPDMDAWLKAMKKYSRRYPEVTFQIELYWYASNFYTVNLQCGRTLETREYHPSKCDECWEECEGCENICGTKEAKYSDRMYGLNGNRIIPNAEQEEQKWKWAGEVPFIFMKK